MQRALLAVALFVSLGMLSLHAAEDLATLMARGDALDAQLQTTKSLECYLAAEKLGPPSTELLCKIAREYGLSMCDTTTEAEKQKRGEKALEYAKRAAAADPQSALANLSAGICYGRVAKYQDNKTKIAYSKLVKQHAEKALRLDPGNDLTYYVLGGWHFELSGLGAFMRTIVKVIYGALPAASYGEAEQFFKKAMALNSNRIATHTELGRTYAALGRNVEARQELNRALALPSREKDDPEAKQRARDALKKL